MKPSRVASYRLALFSSIVAGLLIVPTLGLGINALLRLINNGVGGGRFLGGVFAVFIPAAGLAAILVAWVTHRRGAYRRSMLISMLLLVGMLIFTSIVPFLGLF